LASLANETGARAVAVEDVAKGRDFVVVAIPLCRIPELRYDVLADLPVVIDTSNYYPRQRDGLIAEIEGGVPESRWVEQHLRRPVIKAFNPILAIICATRVCQQALLAGSRWRSQATNLRRKRWPWA